MDNTTKWFVALAVIVIVGLLITNLNFTGKAVFGIPFNSEKSSDLSSSSSSGGASGGYVSDEGLKNCKWISEDIIINFNPQHNIETFILDCPGDRKPVTASIVGVPFFKVNVSLINQSSKVIEAHPFDICGSYFTNYFLGNAGVAYLIGAKDCIPSSTFSSEYVVSAICCEGIKEEGTSYPIKNMTALFSTPSGGAGKPPLYK